MKSNLHLSQSVRHALGAFTSIISALTFSLLANAAVPPSQPLNADALIGKWKDAIYTNREHSHLTLSIIEPGTPPLMRQADIWFKTKGTGDSRILLKFTSPATLRGVAFLSLKSPTHDGADQWLYFPSYHKARRLSSHNRDDAFLDSDFSNGDISFEYEGAFQWTVIGSKMIDNQDTYVIEGKVKASKKETIAYEREVLYVTKSENLNLRSEFYGSDHSLLKVLTVAKWKKYNDHWAADSIKVENVKTKHQSHLEFSNRRLDQDPPDRLFTVGELESGH